MVARRRLEFSNVTDLPLSKRVKRVESSLKKSRPAMRTATFSIDATVPAKSGTTKGFTQATITNITQGDGINQRTGNRIRVWRVEVRGWSNGWLDGYILQNHGQQTLDESFFNDYSGAFLSDNFSNYLFTEWKHWCPFSQDINEIGRFKVVQKFNGMTVKYGGSSSTPTDNALHVCFLNTNTASARSVQCTIRIWFTDI